MSCHHPASPDVSPFQRRTCFLHSPTPPVIDFTTDLGKFAGARGEHWWKSISSGGTASAPEAKESGTEVTDPGESPEKKSHTHAASTVPQASPSNETVLHTGSSLASTGERRAACRLAFCATERSASTLPQLMKTQVFVLRADGAFTH